LRLPSLLRFRGLKYHCTIFIATLLLPGVLCTLNQHFLSLLEEQDLAIQSGLPAEAPSLSSYDAVKYHDRTSPSIEQYMQRKINLDQQPYYPFHPVSQSASISPGPAPQQQPFGYDIASAEISNFTITLVKNGSHVGKGTLQLFGQNGTLLTQFPIEAPLPSKTILKNDLILLKLNTAASSATELLNGTIPTVNLSCLRFKTKRMWEICRWCQELRCLLDHEVVCYEE
jgi:hypothetical protein